MLRIRVGFTWIRPLKKIQIRIQIRTKEKTGPDHILKTGSGSDQNTRIRNPGNNNQCSRKITISNGKPQ